MSKEYFVISTSGRETKEVNLGIMIRSSYWDTVEDIEDSENGDVGDILVLTATQIVKLHMKLERMLGKKNGKHHKT